MDGNQLERAKTKLKSIKRPISFRWIYWLTLICSPLLLLLPGAAEAVEAVAPPLWPWWVWPFLLFALTSALGVLAVLAGIGGSVLFVPIVSGFAPFLHIDFVRGAGLMVALTGALSAGPGLIRANLVNVRMAIPISLVASSGAIVGALVGLALPADVVQISLGVVILFMAMVMTVFKPATGSIDGKRDPIVEWLGLGGEHHDPVTGEQFAWRPKSMLLGMFLFLGVGMMAGMFGLGAGWANVPVLNLVMGVPLKIAVASSYFLLAIADTSAALIYITRGAMLPLVVVPSVLGIMLGARVGSKILVKTRPVIIRRIVIGVLLLAGARALMRGFGI